MKRLFVIALLFVPILLMADEASLQVEQANQLYRSGSYQKAAEVYEQILKNGFESPVLYYNLGNAYFKQQNIPAAILSYERGKRLAPRDEDILYNLRLANLRVVDKIEPLPQLFLLEWWNAFVSQFSSDGWAFIGIVLLWIAGIGGVVYLSARGIILQRIGFIVVGMSIMFTCIAFIALYQRYQAEHNTHSDVVFAQTISIKSAPDNQSTDLFVLHEGVTVEVLDAVGDWRKIRLADGKVGWMVLSNMELI